MTSWWPSSPEILSGTERAHYGCIVTFETLEGGRRFTLHRPGPPRKAIREACAIALVRDEDYRIISYSTPQTIMSDLHGRRPTGGGDRTGSVDSVEGWIATQADLRPMLHPRLQLMLRGKRRPRPSQEWRP